jgi:uncharacterized protein YcbK (DUF882 family)
MDRRSFIKRALVTALFLGTLETPARAFDGDRSTVSMYNTHTDETLTVTFRDGQGYIPDALDKVNRFLRCHYNNEVHRIEPGLMDLLARVDGLYGGGNLIRVISGYRSMEYNAILARNSSGVARASLHTKGMAIDFMIPGVAMHDLFHKVRGLDAGGAGIYPEFVHMDVGRVRTWGNGAA